MATFTDGLDGTPGDALSARAGWNRAFPANNADGIISTDGTGIRFATAVGDLQVLYPTVQPAGADQYVEARMPSGSPAPYTLGVRVNWNAGLTQHGGFFLRLTNNTATGLNLLRRSVTALSSSSVTSLGTGDGRNTTLPFKLVVQGNQVWAEQGGVIVIGPITDVNFPTGKVGISLRGTAVQGTPAHLDNWVSSDLVPPGRTFSFDPIASTGALAPFNVRSGRRLVFPPLSGAGTIGMGLARGRRFTVEGINGQGLAGEPALRRGRRLSFDPVSGVGDVADFQLRLHQNSSTPKQIRNVPARARLRSVVRNRIASVAWRRRERTI